MKAALLIPGLLLFAGASAQQYDYCKPKVNGKELSQFIWTEFHNNFSNLLDTLGIEGVCWVKLKISASGGIKKFGCSPGLPQVLEQFIVNTIRKTSQYWLPKQVNGVNVESEYLLLPIEFTLKKKGHATPALVPMTALHQFLVDRFNVKPEPVIILEAVTYVSTTYHEYRGMGIKPARHQGNE